ncbi:MAG: hypothetical protein OEQ12_06025 [Nitrosopumilus sp.]|nr:hypothetical protein [Nitrosopumilus sp.]
MAIKEELFRAILVTKGRVTEQPHSVTLRGVKYNDKIYFSRHRPDSDWFKNAMADSVVVIKYQDSSYPGIAKVVTDKDLNKKISLLKYPDEKRAHEKRISIEIRLHEQL